jgi:hypothetical protein
MRLTSAFKTGRTEDVMTIKTHLKAGSDDGDTIVWGN